VPRTSLTEELDEEKRWIPHPRYKDVKWFETLVRNEFLPPDAQAARLDQLLARMARFAASAVPYYRTLFQQRRLREDEIRCVSDLPKLPVLHRWDLINHFESLKAAGLPMGDKPVGIFQSSGTTGRPTRVIMTQKNNLMFLLLRHRSNRWRRFDPMGTMGDARTTIHFPRMSDGSLPPTDGSFQLPLWRYDGEFFRTGPFTMISLDEPIEKRIRWLIDRDVNYLISYGNHLEEMAFACEGKRPHENLRGIISVSTQVTPVMQRRIEQTFGSPLHNAYGLNETGFLATLCSEGRYHVHNEHGLIEVVDAQGNPCTSGVPGRVLVTSLLNWTMPLIRYDTDDGAAWATDPCPCGRTLPGLIHLAGRMRRYRFLPKGTRQKYDFLEGLLEKSPTEFTASLRCYQVHLYRDMRLDLRMVATEPIREKFRRYILNAWNRQDWENSSELQIVQVDEIARDPSGKRDELSSDFYEDAERELDGHLASDHQGEKSAGTSMQNPR
jgi:phenylacetate-CoA ligase